VRYNWNDPTDPKEASKLTALLRTGTLVEIYVNNQKLTIWEAREILKMFYKDDSWRKAEEERVVS
jgi:hypothetical protein